MNYSNSSIYKICCNDISITDCYIGSTTNFRQRKCIHKSACNNINGLHYNVYVYQFIRANGGWINWDMVEVERYNAADKRDLHTRERHWIETLGAALNMCIPTRTEREYRAEHKEAIKAKKKDHYQTNKDVILAKQKDYYVNNKEEILTKKKQYAQDNKEAIKARKKQYTAKNKEYREKNKDVILAKNRQRRANQFSRNLHEFIHS